MATSRKDIGPDGHSSQKGGQPDGFTTQKAVDDEADVEGHSMLISPTVGRDLAKARSEEVERSVRGKQQQSEAKRIFRR